MSWNSVESLSQLDVLSTRRLGASLSSLVQTISVNPGVPETGIVDEIERQLADAAVDVTRVESMPGRFSLAAVLTGSGDGPSLVLNGHVDTVTIDDPERWSVDPFGGEIRDGAVWGRGAVDMKGGLAVQIAVARALTPLRDRIRGSLVLHFAAGEERGEPGTLSLLERGFVGDWGITTEPTGLAVATATRGVVWCRITISGRSVHAATPWAGANPIPAVQHVLEALARYDARLRERHHPLVGHPSCTTTMLQAGPQHNAVPDSCEITVDRRLIPGEKPDIVLGELAAVAENAVPDERLSVAVSQIHHAFAPAEVPSPSPFISRLTDAVTDVTGEPARLEGMLFSSDVRNLVNDASIEAVTFGAGDVSQCHCADEHQPLAELRTAALVITRLATELLA